MMNIEVRKFRYAIAAMHLQSFRKVAAVLGVYQSSVSRQVRALEDQLGVSLFERSARGVRVTVAGRAYLEAISEAVTNIDVAARFALDAGRGQRGRLRVGLFSSLASHRGRQLIIAYRNRHPNVLVTLHEGSPEKQMPRLWRRSLDIVLTTGDRQPAGSDSTVLWTERVFVALPASHRLANSPCLSWELLQDETHLVMTDGPGPEIEDYLIRKLATLGFRPDILRHGVGRENLMHLVGMGFGVSLTSEATIATAYPGVVFRPIGDSTEELPFRGVWDPRNDNPSLRRFLSLARQIRATGQYFVPPDVVSRSPACPMTGVGAEASDQFAAQSSRAVVPSQSREPSP